MKISLFYLPGYWPEQHGSVGNLYANILREVEFGERNGFHGVWFAEHHFFRYGGVIPSVPVLATAAAMRTRRLRIGASIAQLPLSDPIRVAEEFAMLDVLSSGRLDFGIGRAFERAEYEAFNVPMGESRSRFEEAHEIILRAWTEERVTYPGRYRTLRDVAVLPKPAQKPLPPIYVACMFSERSFRWAGRQGYNLMYVPYVSSVAESRQRIGWYREALAGAGHDPASRDIVLPFHFFCGESHAHARDYPRRFLSNYFVLAAEANQADADAGEYPDYAGLGSIFTSLQSDYDYMYPSRVIFGDPEECVERIKAAADLGARHVALLTNFGGMPHGQIMRSLERFAKYAMPRIGTLAGRGIP